MSALTKTSKREQAFACDRIEELLWELIEQHCIDEQYVLDAASIAQDTVKESLINSGYNVD